MTVNPSSADSTETITFTDVPGAPNGAWCWYQDERVVVDTRHPDGPMLLMGTVSFSKTDPAEHGDIDLLWYHLPTGKQGAFELHDQLQSDDHDAPAIFIRPDGRYLAVYTKHSSDALVRWRVTRRPHDPTDWLPEQTYENKVRVCYSNVFPLKDSFGDIALYNFSRADGFDPNYFLSHDHGESWRYGGKLLTGPDGNEASGQRPYLKYAAYGNEKLHFILTDGHPRDEDNSIYHGYLSLGTIYRSDGTPLGPLSTERVSPYRAPDFTTVLATGTTFNGVEMRHAWTIDLHVDEDGKPYAAISARADNNDEDHRFLYARWDGVRWRVYEIAKAGGYLYKRENDYTGLVALHPHDPNVIVISTPIDPRNDQWLEHYELFLGRTDDGGANWTWSPITWNSDVDHLRPIIPIWDKDHTALLWLRGGLNNYMDWDSQVVGRIVASKAMDTLLVPGQPPVRRPAASPDP